MRNPSGSLVCLQRIRTDGQKLFLAGARIKRAVHILGRGRERWVCEGYATALSLQAALDVLCRDVSIVVTFAAHNLKSVARKGDRVVADHDRYRCGRCGAAWDDLTWPRQIACRFCGKRAILPAGPLAALDSKARRSWWMPPCSG